MNNKYIKPSKTEQSGGQITPHGRCPFRPSEWSYPLCRRDFSHSAFSSAAITFTLEAIHRYPAYRFAQQ
jgi:hypothetical protein